MAQMLFSFTLPMVLWTRSWKPFRASKKPLGGVREVFWRPLGSHLEPSGGSLGRLGSILGALSPKKPPRIPKEGPKSSPRQPQEAPRGARRPPKGSQETPKKAQEATETATKPHPKQKLEKNPNVIDDLLNENQ